MRQRQWTFMIGAMVVAGCLNDPAFAAPKTLPAANRGDIQGSACYRQNDDEALMVAQKKALNLAREAAIQKIKAYADNQRLEDHQTGSKSQAGLCVDHRDAQVQRGRGVDRPAVVVRGSGQVRADASGSPRPSIYPQALDE